MDNDPLEAHNNVRAEVCLLGDARVVLEQLHEATKAPLIQKSSTWWKHLSKLCVDNEKGAKEMMASTDVPMNYYAPLKIVEDAIHKQKNDFILVSEGSNTMDIGRTILTNDKARQRLDAGTFGTMGVGFGFAIAAQSVHPDKKVVMVVGDSAFGFSGMEVETASRYNLPLKIVIINNNGITMGAEEHSKENTPHDVQVTHLNPESKYEKIAHAFGGKGKEVKTREELTAVMDECLNDNELWIVNVRIDPYAGRKPQKFSWLTRDNDEAKQKKEDAKL